MTLFGKDLSCRVMETGMIGESQILERREWRKGVEKNNVVE